MGLTTAFLFASCIIVSAVSAKQRRDIMLCDGLASCMTAYNRYGDPTAVTAMDQLKTSSVLDSYCSSVSGLGSCVKSEAYMCWFEDEVTEAETAVAMTEYICANKQEYLNIANMPNSCLRTLANPMEAETDYCIGEFQTNAMFLILMGVSDTSEICPLVHEMGSCIIRKMKDVCESEVVAFLDGIMTSFINPLGEKEFGCSPSSTFMRRLVRGAMEKMKMKRSNLIENTFFPLVPKA